jgi:transposase
VHIRNTTVKQNGKVYEYKHLVKSVRRKKDGMPVHKVVASLKDFTPQEIKNLEVALDAARKGKNVNIAPDIDHTELKKPVKNNLQYLDIAVLLSMWNEWGLSKILKKHLPSEDLDVSIADITAALTIHRCVAPGSKLSAQRWFANTALPELLNIDPSKFNNTRIHRALVSIDKGTDALQKRLPYVYESRQDACSALFLDVTDTWFVGHGPDIAQMGKTKEGLFCRKIGIVLMCNQHGFPMRWEVIPGKRQDGNAMSDMISKIAKLSWVGNAPLICDRAMGKAKYVNMMAQSGIRFLTALPVDEFDSYTNKIPHTAFSSIPIQGTPASRKQDLTMLEEAAVNAGMKKISDQQFVLDLDIVEKNFKSGLDTTPEAIKQSTSASKESCASRLALARYMKQKLESGEASSFSHLGKQHGLSKGRVNDLIQLLRLAPDIQEAIENGHAESLSFTTLRSIRKFATHQEQGAAFKVALQKAALHGPNKMRHKAVGRGKDHEEDTEPLRVRGVVYFNPEMFLNQRTFAVERLARIHAFEQDLNRRLIKSSPQRKVESIHGEIRQKLSRYDLIEVFDVTVDKRNEQGKRRYVVSLKLKHKEWERRHRYNGFCFLVGHKALSQNAQELVDIYHAKDAVEKDFHEIKSVVKVRPVRHRTNPKVRAHVTLCMLALLLNRTLEHRLASVGMKLTASCALEQLKNRHLNMIKVTDEVESFYTVTECNDEHIRILDALGLSALADDDEVARMIMPR